MKVTDILIELLKFKSITPDDDGVLNYIDILLPNFDGEFMEKNGVKNLFLKKKFGEGPHICFAGHVDVVPAGDGWESEPFKPLVKDGYIYARGAQDMKSGVAAMISALLEVEEFKGTLSLLLTSDEEGDAIYGTDYVLSILKERNELPDYAVVAEPTCDKLMGDTIKVGRRGSVNGILKILGKQGHVAYPDKCINPANILSKYFDKFADYNLDNGNEFFQPSKIVVTDIRGGMEVTNVTPDMIKIMFNVRNSNLTNAQDIQNYINELFKNEKITLEITSRTKPFLTNKDSKLIAHLKQSVNEICQVEPNLNTAGGTSDARYFAAYGVDVAEFGVVNDTIHAVNERVKIDEVEKLYLVFKNLILKFNDIKSN